MGSVRKLLVDFVSIYLFSIFFSIFFFRGLGHLKSLNKFENYVIKVMLSTLKNLCLCGSRESIFFGRCGYKLSKLLRSKLVYGHVLGQESNLLPNFSRMIHFSTPWKGQKAFGFLTFLGGIEMEQWAKEGEVRPYVIKWVNTLFGTKYSRKNQIKFVEDSL